MASNSEMFERGVQDAERDDLNTFYYQHYYHYRQGYDKARRRLRREPAVGVPRRAFPTRVLGLVAALVFLAAAALFLVNRNGMRLPQASQAIEPTVAYAVPSSTARPTRQARTPTPEPPTATPTPLPTLHLQGLATLSNLSGSPLRLRDNPGAKAKVVARIPEGTEVQILEGPVEADGYTWWKVQAAKETGWAAERSAEGAVWLVPK